MSSDRPPFPRPVVVASRCLEIEACRYNGARIRAPIVSRLASAVDLRPVCPEVEVGLGTPRDPIRLVRIGGGSGRPGDGGDGAGETDRLVQPSTGRDLTEAMGSFAERWLGAAGEVDGFVLKNRSPSCGVTDAKLWGESAEGGPVGKDAGLFTRAVLARFPHAAVEDEGRLTNFRLRHHFLTRVYLRADWRRVRDSGSAAELVDFQARNKLLLLTCHQAESRVLGRLAANPGRRPFAEVAADYEAHLTRATARPGRLPAHVNTLMHALGFFKGRLSAEEKAHFLDLLTDLGAERVTLAVPLALLESWIHRFGEPYLARQTYFRPYPRELTDLSDSGR